MVGSRRGRGKRVERRRVSSRSMCEHFIARASRAVPSRRAVAVHRATRTVRACRVMAGAPPGSAATAGSGRTATSGHSATIPGARPSGRPRRHRPWSTSAVPRACRRGPCPTRSRSTTRPAASRSATTATCAITRTCARRTAPPVASTAAPTPRSGSAGSRMSGSRMRPRARFSRRFTSVSAGWPTSRVLAADGTAHHYAGNDENPVFAFRLGRIGIASTGIYSLDRSLFRFVAPRGDRPPARPLAHGCHTRA